MFLNKILAFFFDARIPVIGATESYNIDYQENEFTVLFQPDEFIVSDDDESD